MRSVRGIRIFFPDKKYIFLHACETYFELPSNMSALAERKFNRKTQQNRAIIFHGYFIICFHIMAHTGTHISKSFFKAFTSVSVDVNKCLEEIE